MAIVVAIVITTITVIMIVIAMAIAVAIVKVTLAEIITRIAIVKKLVNSKCNSNRMY